MKKNKPPKEKIIEDTKTVMHEMDSPEDYVKAASLLSFSNDKTKAVDLLSEGLERFQDSEDIIRAMFSFLCQDFNVLDALYFGEEHSDIFNNDEYNNITKAIDLVRLSLNFEAPDGFTQEMISEVNQILYLFSEKNTFDVAMVTIGLIDNYQLPYVGLGIAKHLADLGDEFAQLILGGSYLKGLHVKKSLHKAEHYLTLSALQGNERAQSLLKKVKTRADFN